MASSIREALNELPTTLDDTYERALQEIRKEKWRYVHRVSQCWVAAIRPLRGDELVEMFAISVRKDPGGECSDVSSCVNTGMPTPTSSKQNKQGAIDKHASLHTAMEIPETSPMQTSSTESDFEARLLSQWAEGEHMRPSAVSTLILFQAKIGSGINWPRKSGR